MFNNIVSSESSKQQQTGMQQYKRCEWSIHTLIAERDEEYMQRSEVMGNFLFASMFCLLVASLLICISIYDINRGITGKPVSELLDK